MESLYNISVSIIGQPQNDVESFLIFFVAACVGMMMIFGVFSIFKTLAGWHIK